MNREADDIAGDLQLDGLAGEGRREQDRADELTRDLAGNGGGSARDSVRSNHHRRTVVGSLAPGIDTELPQGIEKMADRPLVHPPVAVDPIFPTAEGHKAHEKPHGRSRVAGVDLGPPCRNLPPLSLDADDASRPVPMNPESEPLEGIVEDSRVVALEHRLEPALPIGQRRQREGPVGEALRARQLDIGPERALERPDGDLVGPDLHPDSNRSRAVRSRPSSWVSASPSPASIRRRSPARAPSKPSSARRTSSRLSRKMSRHISG